MCIRDRYKRIVNRYEGVLTGKGLSYGGLAGRTEATGYGIVFFAREMLKHCGEELKGKKVAISGFGNVTWGTAQKLKDVYKRQEPFLYKRQIPAPEILWTFLCPAAYLCWDGPEVGFPAFSESGVLLWENILFQPGPHTAREPHVPWTV